LEKNQLFFFEISSNAPFQIINELLRNIPFKLKFKLSQKTHASQIQFLFIGNSNCNHEYFLPFSCKSWFLCPSCHQKRLQLFSQRMNEKILLKLSYRQYVFTLPKMLRPYFRYNQVLFAGISKLISDIIIGYYNELTGKNVQSGIVVSYQTYGDFLRFNPLWHCIVMEGSLTEDGKLHFIAIKDTLKLCELFRRKVIQFFYQHKILEEQKARMLLSWKNSGFSVNNSVRILDDQARENIS